MYFDGLCRTKQRAFSLKRKTISWLLSLIYSSSLLPSVLAEDDCYENCSSNDTKGITLIIAVTLSVLGALVIIVVLAYCCVQCSSKVESEGLRRLPLPMLPTSIAVAGPVVANRSPIPLEYESSPPTYFEAVYSSNYV